MSRANSTFVENSGFVRRFVHICGTKEPAKVARLFNISYQSAKNYLSGRLPNAYVLRSIAETTPYSIHWLLTGEGEKFTDTTEAALELTDEMRGFIKEICLEIISSMTIEEIMDQPENLVVLLPDKIKQEKILEKSRNLAEKEA